MPVLSIIVPIYNSEKYINRCINSILSQTLDNIEIILVNDGSNDRSGKICEEYKSADSRIKVIHKKNGGQAQARNIGLRLAKGSYIGFVDSDDWIENDMYELLYNSCINNNVDISIIGVREINEKGICLSEYIPESVDFSEIMKKAYPCNKIFKKELFIDNNLFFQEGHYYEDLELIPKLVTKAYSVSFISQIGYNYMKHNESTTSSRDGRILDNLWAYIQLKDYLERENLYEKYRTDFDLTVDYFKRYYLNMLYDYPTRFLLKNYEFIVKGFDRIGRLKLLDKVKLWYKHILFVLKRKLYDYRAR